jgi:phosphopantothenoylcysteine decarboxylase / phosphopantothenate---cysteine ligase
VTLIPGPVALEPPVGVTVQRVESAQEMEVAVLEAISDADALLMAAAVADYRPATVAEQKIKKTNSDLSIELTRNPDILMSVREAKRAGLVVIGWAAETQELLANARDKLRRKGANLIVANPVPQTFGGDLVQATLVRSDGHEELPPLSKRVLADRLLDEVKMFLPESK